MVLETAVLWIMGLLASVLALVRPRPVVTVLPGLAWAGFEVMVRPGNGEHPLLVLDPLSDLNFVRFVGFANNVTTHPATATPLGIALALAGWVLLLATIGAILSRYRDVPTCA